jgi:hypothetical protein
LALHLILLIEKIDSETRSNKLYNEYEINYNLIKENITEFLPKIKKLLNGEDTKFSYNNKIFANQITNLFILFTKRNNTENINIFDNVA